MGVVEAAVRPQVVLVAPLPALPVAAALAAYNSCNTPHSPDSLHTPHMGPGLRRSIARTGCCSLSGMKHLEHRAERALARRAWRAIAGHTWYRRSMMRSDCRHSWDCKSVEEGFL